MMKVTVLTRGRSCEAAGLHSVQSARFCKRVARQQDGGDTLQWYGSGYDDIPGECVLVPWQRPGGFFGNRCAPKRCEGCSTWKRCLCLNVPQKRFRSLPPAPPPPPLPPSPPSPPSPPPLPKGSHSCKGWKRTGPLIPNVVHQPWLGGATLKCVRPVESATAYFVPTAAYCTGRPGLQAPGPCYSMHAPAAARRLSSRHSTTGMRRCRPFACTSIAYALPTTDNLEYRQPTDHLPTPQVVAAAGHAQCACGGSAGGVLPLLRCSAATLTAVEVRVCAGAVHAGATTSLDNPDSTWVTN